MRLLRVSVVILVGWGALAFGAEYVWAYAPLLVLAGTIALLAHRGSGRIRFPSRALFRAIGIALVACCLQLVPLPRATIAAISPAARRINYHELYSRATMSAPGTSKWTPPLQSLSIAPARSSAGLLFVATFAVLFVAVTRTLNTSSIVGLARAIAAIGVIVAAVGIIQKVRGGNAVYAFWLPPKDTTPPFAPFINRDHFCGWMAMAVSLSIGLFLGTVEASASKVVPTWRARILWLSSQSANEVMLVGFGILVMALSIILSASRSGVVCLAFVLLLAIWMTARSRSSRVRAAALVACLLVAAVGAVAWGHVDDVVSRFQSVRADDRPAIWRDAIHVARDFPLAGTGLNTFGVAMLHYQTVPGDELYIEAHNDYLQILAEGGLLLALPVALALAVFVREIWRRFSEGRDDTRTYWIRAGAVVGLCAMAMQEFVDFTLQMPGAAVLFVVLAAIAIHRPIGTENPGGPSDARGGAAA